MSDNPINTAISGMISLKVVQTTSKMLKLPSGGKKHKKKRRRKKR